MKKISRKTTKKKNEKKIRYKLDVKSNIIFEDNASKDVNVKFIYDKDEPFYKHTFQEEK